MQVDPRSFGLPGVRCGYFPRYGSRTDKRSHSPELWPLSVQFSTSFGQANKDAVDSNHHHHPATHLTTHPFRQPSKYIPFQ